ncbi:putative repeat protein (TIGR03843 family) [Nocardioides marinisabuli]|uniref:Putative repeat protein (TIGR03843 family) n=1 Tax=Nocardioides marinisabuli TaxID=419476 RepID=A0A7Y9JRC2_9ACTN|nr:SCO1664 family protein [Nocardioides marinisabuli]NYD59062.1 putative repeat protein (TIGR03843 family) [Nocardioides marinisabuli]
MTGTRDLVEDELELQGRILPASNATFLGTIGELQVVYKPIAGERPLWDFPGAVLAHREVAAYVVAQAFAGPGEPVLVPRTWLREGPHGPGMVQEWQEPDPDVEAVTLVPAGTAPEGYLHVFDGYDADDRLVSLVHEDTAALRSMAVLDVLLNNADRKGGHVLAMPDGRRYGVDHGIAFHTEPKLRTVLWGWLGRPLEEHDRAAVERVRAAVGGELGAALAPLLGDAEIEHLVRRCDRLLARGAMPAPDAGGPAIPWPPF